MDVEGFLRKNCESAVQAEKMLRRINSGALLMNEEEEPFIAECIIRIMDIMRRVLYSGGIRASYGFAGADCPAEQDAGAGNAL